MFKTTGGSSWWPFVLLASNSHATTAAQVAANWDGRGKIALVTGGYAGLGLEIARVLASRACKVIIAGRSVSKGESAVAAIKANHPGAQVEFYEMDLSKLGTVKAFAAKLKANIPKLDILVNNAGIMSCPFTLSTGGQELQFATNHLGHFLLTKLLLFKLKEAAKDKKNVDQGWKPRVVTLSSTAHAGVFGIDFENLRSETGYHPHLAYSRSKLANLLFARQLQEEIRDSPIVSVACHPGMVYTGIQQNLSKSLRMIAETAISLFSFIYCASSIRVGAATPVYLATAKDIVGGEYYHSLKVQPSTQAAHSKQQAKRLWNYSIAACKAFL